MSLIGHDTWRELNLMDITLHPQRLFRLIMLSSAIRFPKYLEIMNYVQSKLSNLPLISGFSNSIKFLGIWEREKESPCHKNMHRTGKRGLSEPIFMTARDLGNEQNYGFFNYRK